ncbi:MAG: RNA 2',3'-cyclic phosphodiesterase [Candidatus Eisenbacteria bacterium]|jgi:2'-5' RNA ligase|nr:RNA 2',3'-cyclic phosphodiesterase [Candidatus Eisenbacteria bacterium]
MSAVRVFVAVEPPPEAREALTRAIAAARDQWSGIRWEATAKLHVTLRFLGEIPADDADAVCQAASRAAARHLPFVARLEGVGCYPSVRNPRVVWIGTTTGAEELAMLQRSVEDELAAAGFGRDTRPFTAHLTVGRIKELLRGPQIGGLAVPVIDFPVERLLVKQSTLAPGGSLYTDRGSYPLGGQTRKE